MEKKRSPKRGLEAFFAGKGFYIVLSLCVVVIGVSAWAMLSGTGANVEEPVEDISSLEDYAAAERGYTEPLAPEIETSIPLEPEAPEEPAEQSQAEPVELAEPPAEEDAAAVWSPTDAALTAQQSFYWPVNGEVETPYAVSELVYNRTMSDWRTHAGLDIAAPLGTQVMAAGSGRVESIYTDDLYGVTLVIDHMGGLRSIYANLAETPTVYVGDGLVAGEIIGAVGNTALGEAGEVTHLHFSMTLDGQPVDPADYLP